MNRFHLKSPFWLFFFHCLFFSFKWLFTLNFSVIWVNRNNFICFVLTLRLVKDETNTNATDFKIQIFSRHENCWRFMLAWHKNVCSEIECREKKSAINHSDIAWLLTEHLTSCGNETTEMEGRTNRILWCIVVFCSAWLDLTQLWRIKICSLKRGYSVWFWIKWFKWLFFSMVRFIWAIFDLDKILTGEKSAKFMKIN